MVLGLDGQARPGSGVSAFGWLRFCGRTRLKLESRTEATISLFSHESLPLGGGALV